MTTDQIKNLPWDDTYDAWDSEPLKPGDIFIPRYLDRNDERFRYCVVQAVIWGDWVTGSEDKGWPNYSYLLYIEGVSSPLASTYKTLVPEDPGKVYRIPSGSLPIEEMTYAVLNGWLSPDGKIHEVVRERHAYLPLVHKMGEEMAERLGWIKLRDGKFMVEDCPRNPREAQVRAMEEYFL